jgi:hypothetical protein
VLSLLSGSTAGLYQNGLVMDADLRALFQN